MALRQWTRRLQRGSAGRTDLRPTLSPEPEAGMKSLDHNAEKRTDAPLIDVPEDFDLSDALNKRSDTPAEQRKRCPFEDCQSLSIEPRQPQKPDGKGAKGKYYCWKCERSFDDPEAGSR